MVTLKRTSDAGFTIVELLIVIVVIGILAAITIVAYGGAQQRANNAATASSVNQTVKTILLYQVGVGALPQANGTLYCLTTNNQCTDYNSTPVTSNNGNLIADLSSYGRLPVEIRGGSKYYGMNYKYHTGYTLSGVPNPMLIMFWLDGVDQDCAAVSSTMVSVVDTGVANSFMPARNSRADTGTGQTRCYLMFNN